MPQQLADRVRVIAPDGRSGSILRSELDAALNEGYRLAEEEPLGPRMESVLGRETLKKERPIAFRALQARRAAVEALPEICGAVGGLAGGAAGLPAGTQFIFGLSGAALGGAGGEAGRQLAR